MNDGDRNAATVPGVVAPYAFDPRVSRFTVRAFAGGLLSAFAHNPTFAVRRFTAELMFDPAALAATSVKVSVDAGSLELTDQVSEGDRREIQRIMRDEVLEVERFPKIEFGSERVDVRDQGGGRYHGTVTGPVALHGVTRTVTLEADAVTMGTSLRVYGEYMLKQTEFGIVLVSVAAQAIKIKDELKCAFDLVGRRRQ